MFGGRPANRSLGTQGAEAAIRCRALNIMTRQGMPSTYRLV